MIFSNEFGFILETVFSYTSSLIHKRIGQKSEIELLHYLYSYGLSQLIDTPIGGDAYSG
jgi:hypothetical protein